MKRLLVALCAAALPAALNAQVLGFGSAPQGSIGYNMSSAIAKVMAEDAKASRAACSPTRARARCCRW